MQNVYRCCSESLVAELLSQWNTWSVSQSWDTRRSLKYPWSPRTRGYYCRQARAKTSSKANPSVLIIGADVIDGPPLLASQVEHACRAGQGAVRLVTLRTCLSYVRSLHRPTCPGTLVLCTRPPAAKGARSTLEVGPSRWHSNLVKQHAQAASAREPLQVGLVPATDMERRLIDLAWFFTGNRGKNQSPRSEMRPTGPGWTRSKCLIDTDQSSMRHRAIEGRDTADLRGARALEPVVWLHSSSKHCGECSSTPQAYP